MPYSCVMPKKRTEFIGVSEAARLLGVDVRTVHRKIRRGELPGTKIGDGLRSAYIIDRQAVERYLATRDAA